MTLKLRHVTLLLFSAFFLTDCSTDLDVNATYKEITVVYGLLNQNEEYHFIKINKSFIGEANAYTMAAVRDSSEYKNITATIEQWNNGVKKKEWMLEDTVINNKAAGDFYYPEQTLYYFFEPYLDPTAQYRLIISIDGGAKIVKASTELVNDVLDFTGKGGFQIPCPAGEGGSCVGFYANNQYNPGIDFLWNSVKDGKRYQLKMVIRYKEIYQDGTIATDSIDWVFQPALITSGVDGGEDLNVLIEGEDFYKEIQKQLEPKTSANIQEREFVDFYFTLYVAADDFNTYLLANQPSTGIIQEKPEFTNVENGIGIFSSRLEVISDNKKLTDDAKKELVQGKYTGNLKFCATLNLLGKICQ